MRCLLVGAGAVGQVYGYCLQKGGANVTFLVKEKYAADARAGFTLFPLKKKKRRDPVRFDGFGVVTSVGEAARTTWDYVILCVSSTALRDGDWLRELCEALPGPMLVTLQPGLDDYGYVVERAGPDRVIAGIIGLASYAAPLPGEDVPEPGTAFWMPKMVKCPMSGPSEPTQHLVDALRRGGMPATRVDHVPTELAFKTPILQVWIIALELAGWSIRSLRKNKELKELARTGLLEALAVAEAHTGKHPPMMAVVTPPGLFGLTLAFAARRAPMDLERFFQVHYTKVRDQSRALLDRWIERAEEQGLGASALKQLRHRLTSSPR
jgi:2-dehydropantoate 2-reductase